MAQHSEETIPTIETIAARRRAIGERVAAACERAGRDPASVTMIGVTKTQPAELVRRAAAAGIADVGENYVQEIVAKHQELAGDPAAAALRWHFIGHLQRNKVRQIAPLAAMIHGVDSERLAGQINREAAELGRRMPVLVQVNTSGEKSKSGISPSDILGLVRAVAALPALQLDGLMTVAAPLENPEEVRPMFRLLRRLRDEASEAIGMTLTHLSMGMTGDFEVAIEEGATMVRIGTALFGSRLNPAP